MQANDDPNQYDYPSQELSEEPYAFYSALRQIAPVYKVKDHNDYIISRYDDIKRILARPNEFSNVQKWGTYADPDVQKVIAGQRYPIVPTVSDNDPPTHSIYRLIAAKAFSPRRLRDYEGPIKAMVEDLLDDIAPLGRAEFVEAFANPLPMRVICFILGLPLSDERQFKKWSDDWSELRTLYVSKERALELAASGVEFIEYLSDVVESRKRNLGDDVVSEMLRERGPDGEPLGMPEAVSIVRTMLMAGNETTSALIANTMLLLLQNSDELARVVRDPSLVRRTLEEALRLETSPQWGVRQAEKSCEIGGTQIPAGARLVLMRASANRDETRFEAPDEFCIDRRNLAAHMGFGYGIHYCLGAPLTRLEGRIGFTLILERLRNLRFAPGKNDFKHIHHPSFRVPAVLHIEFDKPVDSTEVAR